MGCSKCNKDKELWNKHFRLCRECNNERLHGSKYGKQYEYTFGGRAASKSIQAKRKLKRISISAPKVIKKESTLHKDEKLYEKVFNKSDHKCEECNKQLPTKFRDEDGKIIARWRYSHIIPKSIAPELRHKVKNINNLCMTCHGKWENGDKESMNIYEGNVKRFPNYL